jgi:predicted dehydrogenase
MRGALIGFGNVAVNAHLPVWLKSRRFTIHAVVEPWAGQARLAREMLPGIRVYPDMESLLLQDGIDFVDICTPPSSHAGLAVAACRSGLHVLCEKPLATSCEELQEIQRASQESGRVVFTVNNWKYAPLWTKARKLVRQGRIGAVRFVSLTVLRPPNSGGGASSWRRCPQVSGGGILLDHGWHHLYLILSIFEDLPTFVSARMDQCEANGGAIEDLVELALVFRKAEARVHLSWRALRRHNCGIIMGDKGTLLINDDHLIVYPRGSGSFRVDFSEPLSGGSHHLEWMKPVIEDFHREMTDVSWRGVNFTEVGHCAQLTSLAYQSHREGGRFIPVPDLRTWSYSGTKSDETLLPEMGHHANGPI